MIVPVTAHAAFEKAAEYFKIKIKRIPVDADYRADAAMDYLTSRKWSLNGLHHPSCVHLCVTLRHTQAGVAERFIDDLKAGVDAVLKHPDANSSMALRMKLAKDKVSFNIAVVFFYNNFKLLHTTMSLVRKSGKLNIFMTTGISLPD